jgi:LPXTG-motif cell wall-anchored protein
MFKRSVLLLTIVSNIFLGFLFATPVLADSFPFSCSFHTSAKSTVPLVATVQVSCPGTTIPGEKIDNASLIGPATVLFYAGTDFNWTKNVSVPLAGTYQLQITGTSATADGGFVTGTSTCCSVQVYGGPVVTPAPTAPPVITPAPTTPPVVTPRPTATPRPIVTPVPVVTPAPVITPAPVVTPIPTRAPTTIPTVTPTPAVSPTPAIAPPVVSATLPPAAPVNNNTTGPTTGIFLVLLGAVIAAAGVIALVLFRRQRQEAGQTPPVETPPSETPPSA